jgi:hypothetical protein
VSRNGDGEREYGEDGALHFPVSTRLPVTGFGAWNGGTKAFGKLL